MTEHRLPGALCNVWLPDVFPLDSVQTGFLEYWHHSRPFVGGVPLREERYRAEQLAPFLGDLIVAEPWGDDFRARLCGTRLVDAWGYDITGRLLSEVPDRRRMVFGRIITLRALAEREPVAAAFEGTLDFPTGFRCVAVPVQSRSGLQILHHVVPVGPQLPAPPDPRAGLPHPAESWRTGGRPAASGDIPACGSL
jgi:hypothetical protein